MIHHLAPRALFLDRDGVINREVGYLHRSEDVVWVDGIFPLARTAVRLGYKLVVVTNQSGIARGYYDIGDFEKLMDWMKEKFVDELAPLDAVYFCPHHPEHGVGIYRREHIDRKPGPGMLLRAADQLGLDLTQSIMIGDRCSDVAAANAGGLLQAFLIRGTETGPCSGKAIIVDVLAEVEVWLLSQTSQKAP